MLVAINLLPFLKGQLHLSYFAPGNCGLFVQETLILILRPAKYYCDHQTGGILNVFIKFVGYNVFDPGHKLNLTI